MIDENELSNGYYLTKGILIKDDANYVINIIPIWDSRVTYKDHDLYGPSYKLDRDRQPLVDVLFNINTKQLLLGVEINLYSPSYSDFNVGDIVYVNVNKGVYKSSIKDIIYTDYKLTVYKGKDLEDYLISRIKQECPNIQITVDSLYCIKDWIPYFLLEDNKIVKWEHELFKELINNKE
jgi:hypothetical protein